MQRARIVSIGAALGMCVTAAAAEPLELPLRIENGQRMQLSYTYTKRQNDQTQTAAIQSALYVIDANSDPDNLLIEWVTQSVSANGVKIDSRSPQAADLFIGVPITFVAAADLSPVRIFDREDFMNRLFNAEFFASIDNKSRDGMRTFFMDMEDGPLAQLLLKVPGYLAVCHETALTPGEPTESQTALPSVLPDVAVTATIRYSVDVTDASTANVRYSSTHDPESLKAVFKAMVAKSDAETKPTDEEMDQFRVERTDIADCDVDRDTGWVRRMTFAIEVISPQGEYGERYDIDAFRTN